MCFRRVLPLVLLVVLTSLFAVAAPRNVVLITLDTTRADRMGFLGSKRGLTPNLDALAAQSVVFTRAYSQVPLTTASHATILTGTYPQFHKVNDVGVPLAKDVPYLPAILAAHGYKTAAFVGAVILDPVFGGAPGFDRGFAAYDAGFRARHRGEDRYQTLERRGGEVASRAVTWLGKHPAGPFLLWLHLYDPHAPYDPPQPFKGRYASDLYDGEIAYADSVVGKFLEQLRAQHLYDDALIVVMADHGEALGEHGERGHGIFLYDPTIHVPLLFKLPRDRFGGKRIDSRAGLVDVAPTILGLLGLPVPGTMQGRSLLASVDPAQTAAAPDHDATADRPAYSETDYPHQAFGWSALRSLRAGKYLLIEAPRKELYDQSSDPGTEHDLASSSSAVTETLTTQLEKFRRETASSRTARASLAPQQQAKLNALGYVASSEAAAPGMELTGPDPKDKIAIANQVAEALLQLESDNYREAIAQLQDALAKDPNMSSVCASLGTAYTTLGDYSKAIPVLRKAIALRPNSVTGHYDLGLALFNTGDLKSAAQEFEAAVALSPRSAEMRYSLASVYVRINRMDDARKQLQQSLQLKANDYDANLMLGQVFIVQKNPAAALPYLQRAAKIQPSAGQAHEVLATAYAQLGQEEKARRERALAQQ